MEFNLKELSISVEIELSESFFGDVIGELLEDIFIIDFFLDFWCDVCIGYVLAIDLGVFIFDEKLVTYLHQIPLLFFLVLDNWRNHEFVDVRKIGKGK